MPAADVAVTVLSLTTSGVERAPTMKLSSGDMTTLRLEPYSTRGEPPLTPWLLQVAVPNAPPAVPD